MDTTECDKIKAVKDKSHAIGEFVDWLRDSKGFVICEEHNHDESCLNHGDLICGMRNRELFPAALSMERLLAEFFEIDLNKVEEEKQALLDQQRAINAYYEHLDTCTQCEQHPFNQCPTGQELLVAAGAEAQDLLRRSNDT